MADYKVDGKYLRARNGSKLGEFDGKYFRGTNGSKIGKLNGKYIRDAKGSKLAEFDGDNIRSVSGSKIGTIKDVQKVIDGPGGVSLVGFWLLFIR